jgi:YVTN family beta-propeller protein
MKKLFLPLLMVLAMAFTGCEKDDSFSFDVTNKSGYYVINEGSWGKANASVGFITNDGKYHADLFGRINNRVLGDVLQSVGIHNQKAYMVLNGSNKIEIMTANTFEELGVIEGFYGPRYIEFANGKAYVSQWGDFENENAAVKVIDLSTNKIIKSIATGAGSERMVVVGSKLLVANSGGYGNNNTISVIDTNTDEVTKTVTLDEDSPKGFVVDKNGNVWVLCYGSVVYNAIDWTIIDSETRSALVKLSDSFEPSQTIVIANNQHPVNIAISPAGDVIYYGGGYTFNGIYAFSIDAAQVSSAPIINGYFYGLTVNPSNGEIVGLQAPSFTDAGTMARYTANGTAVSAVAVGIGPSGAILKQ